MTEKDKLKQDLKYWVHSKKALDQLLEDFKNIEPRKLPATIGAHNTVSKWKEEIEAKIKELEALPEE